MKFKMPHLEVLDSKEFLLFMKLGLLTVHRLSSSIFPCHPTCQFTRFSSHSYTLYYGPVNIHYTLVSFIFSYLIHLNMSFAQLYTLQFLPSSQLVRKYWWLNIKLKSISLIWGGHVHSYRVGECRNRHPLPSPLHARPLQESLLCHFIFIIFHSYRNHAMLLSGKNSP